MAEKKTTTTQTKKRTYTKREKPAASEISSEKVFEAPEISTEKVQSEAETVKTEAPAKPTFTEDEVQAMIAQAVAKAVAQAQVQAAPQVIQVAQDVEKVHFLWMAEVSDDNVVTFGEGGMYGRITGKTGSFFVPKSEISRILDSMNRHFMDRRWLIVVSGLNEEERESLGVNYKEGEILDRKAFKAMLDLGDDIIPIYRDLCDGHKEMVAKRYYEAFRAGKPKPPRSRIVALKEASGSCESAAIAFKTIIEEMNAADAN